MAKPLTFDAAAFVADLRDTGCRVWISWSARPDDDSYFMGSPFGHAYSEVMSRWADRIAAFPDHAQQVNAFLNEEAARV